MKSALINIVAKKLMTTHAELDDLLAKSKMYAEEGDNYNARSFKKLANRNLETIQDLWLIAEHNHVAGDIEKILKTYGLQ